MPQEDFTTRDGNDIPNLPFRTPSGMSDAELLDYLERIAEARAVPPCRVCGSELVVAAIGGGKSTEWTCPQARPDYDAGTNQEARRRADAHYRDSRWVQYREENSYVSELVGLYRALACAQNSPTT